MVVNLASNTIGEFNISTGEIDSVCDRLGGAYKTWETIVFNINPETRQRDGIKKFYYHRSAKQAVDFHFRFCRTFAYFNYLKFTQNGKLI